MGDRLIQATARSLAVGSEQAPDVEGRAALPPPSAYAGVVSARIHHRAARPGRSHRGQLAVLLVLALLSPPVMADAPALGELEMHHARPGEALRRRPAPDLDRAFTRDIVKLSLLPESSGGKRRACTATLLQGGRHILTAHHCVLDARGAAPFRGRYQLIFGYREDGWIPEHDGVLEGVDLFAAGAVRAWPELDVALVRLSAPVQRGVLRREGDALRFEASAAARGPDLARQRRGIALLPARFEPIEAEALFASMRLPGAGRPPAEGARLHALYRSGLASALGEGALYGYSADLEIGRRGRLLTKEPGCAKHLGLRAGGERDTAGTWVRCRAHPGASGGPYLRASRADGRIYLTGVAIESEREERRVRMIPVWAFREDALAFMAIRAERSDSPPTAEAHGSRDAAGDTRRPR